MDRKVINNNKNNIYFPMDWEIVSISSIADIEGGKRLPRGHKLTDTNTLFPYIRIVDFKNMSADKKNIKYINPSTKEIIANYTISSKDVYLTIAGTVGLAGLIPIELDGANLTENAVKICNLRDVIKEYLAYVLNFSFIKKQISTFIGKAQQPKLAIFRIKKIKIPLPKIKEQEKIAEILLNMDKTINEVSNAIKKAENLKKGLMQKLLTRGIGHKEFKYTEIGKIPDNWQIEKIENIFNIFGGTTPSTSVKEFWNGNINWVTPSDLNKLLQNIYLIQTEKKITEEAVKKYSLNIFNENNILLSTRASIGLVAINKFPVTINQGMTALIPKNKSTISPYYFMYYFSWIKKYLNQLAAGSTFREISKSTIRNINVRLPEFKEQEKIAEILLNMDKTIDEVNNAIKKAENLKKGLMQKLLTKGIRHKEFKYTENRKIPIDWEIINLNQESYLRIIMGQSPPSSTYNYEGIGLPFLQGKAEFGDIYPKPILFCSNPLKIAEKDSILLSVRAPVGDVNITPHKLCIGRGLLAIEVKKEKLNNYFLYYYLSFIKKYIESLSSGSTFKAITKSDMAKVEIPIPDLAEQEKITEILSATVERVQLLKEKKQKLERIKAGLMNDLLTGRKRVKLEA